MEAASRDRDLQDLADRLLAFCARSRLRPEDAYVLTGCAGTLLCRVRPSPQRLAATISALRSAGGDSDLEAALLKLGPDLTEQKNP